MELAQACRIDAVLVTQPSRWGSSTQDLLDTLYKLAGCKVSVIAMSAMTFEFATPYGRVMATMLAGIAQSAVSLASDPSQTASPRRCSMPSTGGGATAGLHATSASARTSSPSTIGMRRLVSGLELIEETDVLGIDVSWVYGNYQRALFHTVRMSTAARLRRVVAPRRHLALVCFLHQAWRDTFDQAVDMYGKLLDRSRKLVMHRLDEKLKAQRHGVDRIVQRYHDLATVLLDPAVGDGELRARLLAVVPENELLEDRTDLARWTRGDRRARFEETVERHSALRRFAAPFPSRMSFLDERDERASPMRSQDPKMRTSPVPANGRPENHCYQTDSGTGSSASDTPGTIFLWDHIWDGFFPVLP